MRFLSLLIILVCAPLAGGGKRKPREKRFDASSHCPFLLSQQSAEPRAHFCLLLLPSAWVIHSEWGHCTFGRSLSWRRKSFEWSAADVRWRIGSQISKSHFSMYTSPPPPVISFSKSLLVCIFPPTFLFLPCAFGCRFGYWPRFAIFAASHCSLPYFEKVMLVMPLTHVFQPTVSKSRNRPAKPTNKQRVLSLV